MSIASARATCLVESGAGGDVVDVGAPAVVDVVSPGGRLDVVVVVTGPHVGSPVGNGGAPLFTAHVMTTCWPGVYVITARWSSGTPRLLGPRRLGRNSALRIRTSSSRPGFVVVVVDSGTVVAVVGAVVGCVGWVGAVVVFVGWVGGCVGGVVGGCVGGVVGGCVGGVVGGCVGWVGGGVGWVGGCVGGVVDVGGGTVITVGGTTVVVVRGSVETVVDGARVVVGGSVVVGSVVLAEGCVGTVTLLSSSLPSATNAMRPIAQAAITTPATTRAAVTSWLPLRDPSDLRIESAARAARTNATIVPTIGSTMLTIAQTSAATANGSTLGSSPHPPGPSPRPDAPVGSGSGPTGTAPVSGPSEGGPAAGTGSPYRQSSRHTRQGRRVRARR
jgi:hypothetical protein